MFSFYIVCSVNNENKTAKDDSPKSACNMRNPADNDSDATDTENVFDCENLTADDRDHGVTSEDKNVLTQTYVDSVQNSDDVEGLPEKVSNKDGMKHKKKKSSDGQIAKKSRRVRQDCDKSPGGAVSQLTSVLGGGFGRLCDKCGRLVGGKHRCQREVKKDPVECPECGIKCSNRPNLRRHMMQHTGERPHLCQHCGAGFIQRQSLQDHVTSYHPETVPYDPCIVGRQCPDCGQTFYKSGQLQKHMRSQCGAKPRSALEGQRVPREHDALRPYACTKCERRFKLKASLIIHDRVHAERKPMPRVLPGRLPIGTRRRECHICGKKSMTASQLRAHMVSHTGELSHVCKTCGKAFRHLTLLVSHERVHTGEKPFACTICGKLFAHDSELRNHMRVHTDEKPFECSVCGKRLRQNAHLQTHMRTHTGEKPFRCQLCDKSYKNLVDLRFHYRRMHQFELPKRPGRRSFMDEEIKEGQSV